MSVPETVYPSSKLSLLLTPKHFRKNIYQKAKKIWTPGVEVKGLASKPPFTLKKVLYSKCQEKDFETFFGGSPDTPTRPPSLWQFHKKLLQNIKYIINIINTV